MPLRAWWFLIGATPEMIKKKNSKRSGDIDIQIGSVLRAARRAKGLSQQDLAEKINRTFQQLQKYERGVNRISASVLYELTLILNIPYEDFFKGYPKPTGSSFSSELANDEIKLLHLYRSSSSKLQKTIIKLLTIKLEEGKNV